MKYPLFAGLLTAMLAHCAYGAYTTNFDDPPWSAIDGVSPGDDVNGIDNWTINDTTDQFSQVAYSNINPSIPTNFSQVLNLGGSTDLDPIGSSVVLSHPSVGTVGATHLIFDFVLFDSFDIDPARNEFGVSMSNGGSNIFGISFVPDPLDVGIENPSSDEARWNIYYQVGNAATVPLNLSVFELSQYRLDLSFNPNAGNPALTDFLLSITSAVPNSLSDGALALSMSPTAVTDALNVSWSESPSSSYGSNSILIDNLSLVPEPSSTLLAGLAALGLLRRRRTW